MANFTTTSIYFDFIHSKKKLLTKKSTKMYCNTLGYFCLIFFQVLTCLQAAMLKEGEVHYLFLKYLIALNALHCVLLTIRSTPCAIHCS